MHKHFRIYLIKSNLKWMNEWWNVFKHMYKRVKYEWNGSIIGAQPYVFDKWSSSWNWHYGMPDWWHRVWSFMMFELEWRNEWMMNWKLKYQLRIHNIIICTLNALIAGTLEYTTHSFMWFGRDFVCVFTVLNATLLLSLTDEHT